MSIILQRKKKRNFKLSLMYKIKRLIPLNKRAKLKLFLDLAWIFSRLAHEEAARMPKTYINSFLIDNVKTGDKVLDIGCGNGNVIRQLITKTKNITGIDYDKQAIEELKTTYGNNVDVKSMDVFDFLNQNDEKFDVIILSHVLEHIDKKESLLRSLSNRTTYLYVEVPDFECNYLNTYRVMVNTDLIYSDADHIIEFDRDDLKRLIEKNGFRILNEEFRGSVIKYWCCSNEST